MLSVYPDHFNLALSETPRNPVSALNSVLDIGIISTTAEFDNGGLFDILTPSDDLDDNKPALFSQCSVV